MFIKIPFLPGVYRDDSPLSAEGFFVDADKVRFVRGKAQTIGGWEIATGDTLTGLCRGIHPWLSNEGLIFAGLGSHQRLHCYFDGEVYDITPVIERGELSNPLDTTSASATVTINDAAHGLVIDQKVKFFNASAVGGITVNGEYIVSSVIDPDSYTIEHAVVASSTAASGGGTVDFEYSLAPGNVDGTGGAGYGTGSFGVGGYGASSNIEYFPRTWSMSNWGQNLVANPRGGGIYEWAPNLTASELVETGDFVSDSNWVKGTDWTIAAGVATRVPGAGSSDLAQSISLPQGAWCLLDFDVTAYTAGNLQPIVGTANVGAAIAAVGTYKRVFFSGGGGAQELKFSADAAGDFSIDNVSVQVLLTAHVIDNAPVEVTSIFVTPERMLVALGCTDSNGNFDPLLVCWSDQENNQQWIATALNTAGFFKLAKGGRIVGGKAGRGENYIFTDEGLYVMRFVPDPSVVYRFDHVGSGCGLLGPNAATVADGQVFWLSNSGAFYSYAGGVPQALQCTLRRDVFDNLAKVQGDKVFAFTVAAYNEVWWLYPDGRDGNECSRYVAFNYVERTWTAGRFNRTAWHDSGILRFPVATDTDGRVFFQEKGFSADGVALTWSLNGGYSDFGNGGTFKNILGLLPDFEDLRGGVDITVGTKTYSNDAPTFDGPHGVTASTKKVDLRSQGREISLNFSGSSAPAFMRMGQIRADVRQTGRTR